MRQKGEERTQAFTHEKGGGRRRRRRRWRRLDSEWVKDGFFPSSLTLSLSPSLSLTLACTLARSHRRKKAGVHYWRRIDSKDPRNSFHRKPVLRIHIRCSPLSLCVALFLSPSFRQKNARGSGDRIQWVFVRTRGKKPANAREREREREGFWRAGQRTRKGGRAERSQAKFISASARSQPRLPEREKERERARESEREGRRQRDYRASEGQRRCVTGTRGEKEREGEMRLGSMARFR